MIIIDIVCMYTDVNIDMNNLKKNVQYSIYTLGYIIFMTRVVKIIL